MKTTIDLPEAILIAAKKKAAEERTSLRKLVIRSLRRELEAVETAGQAGPRKIHFLTVDGGLPLGLDMSDRSAMNKWLRSGS